MQGVGPGSCVVGAGGETLCSKYFSSCYIPCYLGIIKQISKPAKHIHFNVLSSHIIMYLDLEDQENMISISLTFFKLNLYAYS